MELVGKDVLLLAELAQKEQMEQSVIRNNQKNCFDMEAFMCDFSFKETEKTGLRKMSIFLRYGSP